MSRTSAVLCLLAGCTVFDDVTPPQVDGAGGGGADTSAGGAGGATEQSCTVQSPRCLLPLIEAARLCALVAQCDPLSGSIALSTGLPLATLDADGQSIAFNFSTCVDWLTRRLEDSHAGFESARAVFNCLAATSTCTEAAACLTYEALALDDPRCDGERGRRCEGQSVIDCDERRISHCDELGFAVSTECVEGADGAVCRLESCTEPGVHCQENPPGVHYAIACTAGGDEIATNCTAHGLSCTEQIGCTDATGSDELCDPPFAQACNGAKKVAVCAAPLVTSGMRSVSFDCGATGDDCIEASLSARCAQPEASCSPYDAGINVCEAEAASVLGLCIAGQRTTFDCASLGMVCANGDGEGRSGRCAP